ncbi:cytochrome P-450 cyp509A1, partial [Syncephalastrum racemosum]
FIGSNILYESGERWRRHRKIANPAFHRSMPVELFGRLSHKLFEVMDETGPVVNFENLTTRWTLDALGLAGFDFDFQAIVSESSPWVRTYESINTGMFQTLYILFPFLERYFLWLLPKRHKQHQDLTELLDLMRSMVEKKQAAFAEGAKSNIKDNEKDLLTLMIEQSEDEGGILSNEELMSNLCVFLLAGHDTTSSALAYAAYYLAINPDIQEKARQEAISVFGDEPHDVLPTVEETKNMPYINQIIKETLRINPPVSTMTSRICVKDTVVNDTVIPKGARVAVNVYELHHNEEYWHSPLIFNPDRFAPGGEAELLASTGVAYMPFGTGSRHCIGMNFSLAEQRVLLPLLLRKYTWSLPEDSPHKDHVITTGSGVIRPIDLKIKFQKRY